MRPHVRRRRQDLLAALAVADIHATVEAIDTHRSAALERMRATVAALERARFSQAVDGASGAAAPAGELALPASVPPAGVLPASVSGGD